ncbi:hypothetical protein BGP_3285 [Beggiatoa sp. PS]|nr:hypothetical protein BGP_3285 [Beggiatoa sp. PS]
MSNAPKKYKCPSTGNPLAASLTAPAAKINTGIYNGNTNKESNTPPRRKPTVKATPIAPTKLKIGVPNTNVAIKVGIACSGKNSNKLKKGANTMSGKPVISQCANTFANTSNGKECADKVICSKEPSSKSERNRLSSDNIAANKAVTQITPGAIPCKSLDSGEMPNGNRLTTIIKNNNGLANSARWR